MSQWLKHTHKLTWSDAHISYETLKVKLDDDIIIMISPFHQTCKRCLKMSEMERTIPKRPSAINKGLRTIDSLNASSDSQSVKMFAFSEYCRVLSIWIRNFVQHRLHVCLVIISLRMWRQMAQRPLHVSASEAFCRTTAALPESAPTLILHPNNFSSEFREWCRGRMPATLCISPPPGAPWPG